MNEIRGVKKIRWLKQERNTSWQKGMTWSGFRPSDDACQYGYLVPSNMFAVVILGYIQEIFSDVLEDATIVAIAKNYKKRLKKASKHLDEQKSK